VDGACNSAFRLSCSLVIASRQLALLFHPDARRLVLISGTALLEDILWTNRLREEAIHYQRRVTVELFAGLPASEVESRLGVLGNDAVVFTPSYFEDGAGRRILPRESVEAMVPPRRRRSTCRFTVSWARASSAVGWHRSRQWENWRAER
jgi:hypothetical protein